MTQSKSAEEKKGREGDKERGGSFSLTPYPYPPCFSCSHLFASRRLSPQAIDHVIRYNKILYDFDAFWSFSYIWFRLFCAQFSNALLGIAQQWIHEKFAILSLRVITILI